MMFSSASSIHELSWRGIYDTGYCHKKWNLWLKFKILNEAVCISFHTNVFWKGMNPFDLALAKGI